MPHTYLRLLSLPILASAVIFSLATLDKRLWMIQLAAIGITGVLAFIGTQIRQRTRITWPVKSVLLITLLGLAAPLLTSISGPQRWILLGPLNLYVAPVLLPSFLIACAVLIAQRGVSAQLACAAMIGASVLLSIQPDASQVLALLAALVIVFWQCKIRSKAFVATLILVLLNCIWAFTRPDPLQPIAYVEGVFELAFDHSLLAGIMVAACASAFLIGLNRCASEGQYWLSAVAAYYAVLFGCSLIGLTPAPLIGYGAGPWLGFGLMLASARLANSKSVA
jgi:cell division protein FtsW (lipid II flippase)